MLNDHVAAGDAWTLWTPALNYSGISDEILSAIAYCLSDVGMPASEPWAYWLADLVTLDTGRSILGHLVAPDLQSSRTALISFPVAAPFAWEERHKGYRVEMFGRQVLTESDDQTCHRDMRWVFEGTRRTVIEIAAYRARTIRTAGVHARADWRPGWPDVKYSYGNVRPGVKSSTREADIGFGLLGQVQAVTSGRKRLEEDVDSGWRELTRQAVAWKHEHPDWSWEAVARKFHVSERQLRERRGRL